MGLLDEYDKNQQVTEVKPPSPTSMGGGGDLDDLPGIIGWLARHSGGLIKNKAQANYAVIGMTIISLAILFYSIF